jgi:hypothetical protein
MLSFRTHTFLYVLLPIFISTLSFTTTDKVKDLSSWTELGTVTVSEGAGYDILEVPEQQEQVKYLKVKVLKSTVYVKALKVMYSDKTSEYHSISNPLKKGSSTSPFELIGYYRTIEKIIFVYGNRNVDSKGAQLVVLAKM